ncbi:hypothetical protein BW730_13560 [Tessaracoccus aquimaris]|uniref:HTH marR-type domain-containing protein n=1 Tax=Tessaracoccus aquimaris TaxID=1332264 RepID=A0A1Q2CQI5_9ACTN|nr:ROK family transcriptional regulator [Tessaracoccus aquimaris]AQP48376.1 hypothetical protein BW730_13560 [Tessaracoccus aquimaris]
MAGSLDSGHVRRFNIHLVLRHLREAEGSTASELAGATGLSRPSVNGALAELERLGWIASAGMSTTDLGGRPARRHRFHASAGLLLGVDIGVHGVRVVVGDLSGTLLDERVAGVAPEAMPDARLAVVDALIDAMVNDPGRVWAMGIAVTGPVDSSGRTALFSPLPGWAEVDLPQRFGRRFGWPVLVGNDVKVALLAERQWGVADGVDDVAFVLAGARIGAAATVGGMLLRGHGGAAGEVGALPAVRWGRAVRDLVGNEGALVPGMDLAFRAAASGERGALARVERFADDVATGAAAVTLMLDPEVLVIGGRAAAFAELWVPRFSASLAAQVLRMPEIRISTLGGNHVARGALRLAMLDIERRFFGDELVAARAPRP